MKHTGPVYYNSSLWRNPRVTLAFLVLKLPQEHSDPNSKLLKASRSNDISEL